MLAEAHERIKQSCSGRMVLLWTLERKEEYLVILKKEVPYTLDIHCLPNRLELALQTIKKGCESVECIYDVLHLIWKTYHYSPKSVRIFRCIAELSVDILNSSQVRRTYWLPHVSCALNVFVGHSAKGSGVKAGQFAAVLIHMEHLSTTSGQIYCLQKEGCSLCGILPFPGRSVQCFKQAKSLNGV